MGLMRELVGDALEARRDRKWQRRQDEYLQGQADEAAVQQAGSYEEVQYILEERQERQAQQRRRKNAKRLVAAVTVGAVVAGGGYLAKKFVQAPPVRVERTTSTQVRSALSQVVLRNEAVVLSGRGQSAATISSEAKACVIGCIPILGSGEKAGATVKASLDVGVAATGITLQASQNDGTPGWHILANVNTADLRTSLSGEQETTYGNDQLGVQLLNAAHVNMGSNERHDAARGIAETDFQASCAKPLTPVFAPALAVFIKAEVRQTAALLQGLDPKGAGILRQLASQPVYEQFYNGNTAANTTRVVAPSQLTLPVPPFQKGFQVKASTPGAVGSIETDFSLQISGTNCGLKPGAEKQIAAIEADGGYQPVGGAGQAG